MNPLIELKRVFQSHSEFIKHFGNQSLITYSRDLEEIEEFKKDKKISKEQINYYQYSRSSESFSNYIYNLTHQSLNYIEEEVDGKSNIAISTYINKCINDIEKVQDDIGKLFVQYPMPSQEKLQEPLENNLEFIRLLSKSRTETPFAIERIDEMAKLAEQLQNWKANEKGLFSLTKEEIIALTLLNCEHAVGALWCKIHVRYEDTLSMEMNNADTNITASLNEARNKVKHFSEYLLHQNRMSLANQLKSEFKTEKGKVMRLMLMALEERNILFIANRERKNIYQSMKNHFNREIGTYQSIFDFQYTKIKDQPDYDAILKKVDFILASLNNNK